MLHSSAKNGRGGEFLHPELHEGELFFTNSDTEGLKLLTLTTIRKGVQAFDGEGNLLYQTDWFPVFVQSEELNALNLSLSELRRRFREEHVIRISTPQKV